MLKYNVILSGGTEFYTDDMGRELILGLKQQRQGSSWVSVNFFASPDATNPSSQVEVNRDHVTFISRA